MRNLQNQHLNKLTILSGIVLIVVGIIATHDLFCPRDSRIMPSSCFPFSFIGIPTFFAGLATFFRGLGWRGKPSSWRTRLRIGYLMLVIGGFPWLYTWIMVGGSPGNEGAGMLGTLIFICVGLPGIALVLISLVMRPKKTMDKNHDA